jgi:hypothetical protein
MKLRWDHRLMAGLMVAALACGAGCNIAALPFFLSGGKSTIEPKCKLAAEDKEKTVRVIILASSGLEIRPEFLRTEDQLSRLVAEHMREGYKESKDKVTVVSTSQVAKYKDEHPNWSNIEPSAIGKYFDADYVIELTINSVSLYEPGSAGQIFQGRADISVDVVDVNNSSEGPKFSKDRKFEYPRGGRPELADQSSPAQFRQKFFDVMAREISWYFVEHDADEDLKVTD